MKSYKLEIVQDDTPLDPRADMDNLGIMICFHKRYQLGDKNNLNPSDFNGWNDIYNYIKKTLKGLVILPLFLYDHSGITISTSYTYPYDDRWDAGVIGFIYATRASLDKMGLKTRNHKKIAEFLRAEVKTYDQYLTGDIWGFQIKDTDTGEVIDSCWGFYGRNYCQDEGKSALKAIQEQDAKEELHALDRLVPYMVTA